MPNSKIMNINLTRGEVCDVLRAITSVKVDFMRDRRKIAESSFAMCEKLYNEIKSQLNKFDEEAES